MGKRNLHAVEQDDEEDSAIPRLRTQTPSRKYNSRFMRLEMSDARNHWPTLPVRKDLQATQLQRLAVTASYNWSLQSACAASPFCDLVLHISRDKFLPTDNRGIQIPKTLTTIGGHLRRRRLQLRIFQPEAARRPGVSIVWLKRCRRHTDQPLRSRWVSAARLSHAAKAGVC